MDATDILLSGKQKLWWKPRFFIIVVLYETYFLRTKETAFPYPLRVIYKMNIRELYGRRASSQRAIGCS